MRLLKSELEVLEREVERQLLLSLPAKIRFMEAKGFKDIDQVHTWMIETAYNFKQLVKTLKERSEIE